MSDTIITGVIAHHVHRFHPHSKGGCTRLQALGDHPRILSATLGLKKLKDTRARRNSSLLQRCSWEVGGELPRVWVMYDLGPGHRTESGVLCSVTQRASGERGPAGRPEPALALSSASSVLYLVVIHWTLVCGYFSDPIFNVTESFYTFLCR